MANGTSVLALARYMGQEAVSNVALLEHITAIAPETIRRAIRYSGLVLKPQRNPHEQIGRLQQVIRGITVMRHRIDIAFSRAGLMAVLTENREEAMKPPDVEGDEYKVSVPVRLKRCGIETRFIVPGGDTAPAHPALIRAVEEALAKALEWNEALLHGAVSSMNVLAKREGVTQRYIAHLIKLAWLAPDIMEAITRGDIPSSVSLDRLKKDFPPYWDKQRKVLGFTA